MQPSSAAFAEAVTRSHTICTRVDVWDGDALVASTETGEILLVDGGVDIDRQANIRRHMTMTFVDPDPPSMVPTQTRTADTREVFDPLSYLEFRPWRGIEFPDGTKEYIPLGVVYLSSTEIQEDQGGVTFHCTADDRSDLISENKWQTIYNPPAETFQKVMSRIVLDRAVHFDGSMQSIPDDITANSVAPAGVAYSTTDDPWQMVMKLGDSGGLEPFFEATGLFVVRIPADPTKSIPVLDFSEGANGVRLSPLNRIIDRKTARSGVVVNSSAPWLLYPVSATVWDTDPTSPTFYKGPFGMNPEIIDNATVSNDADALKAAQAKFDTVVGVVDDIKFNSLVDPRLDVGDVISINSPRENIAGNYVLDTLNIPMLAMNGMSGTTKKRRRKA